MLYDQGKVAQSLRSPTSLHLEMGLLQDPIQQHLALPTPGFPLGFATSQLCTCSRLLDLSVPQFPHLQNGDNNRAYLLGLLRGVSELIHVKCSVAQLVLCQYLLVLL